MSPNPRNLVSMDLNKVREQPFDFYWGGGEEELQVIGIFVVFFFWQDFFFRRPFGPGYFF